MARSPSPWSARAALLGLAALVAAGILDPGAPVAVGVDAPAERFSAGRAMELVERIAVEPHPLDSDANDRVRVALERRLDELGIAWERQPWSEPLRVLRGQPPVEARGVNLLARLPRDVRSDQEPVVLFVTHFDARPGMPTEPSPGFEPSTLRDVDRSRGAAPGAGDAGAAVAAFLEALRALKEGAALRNELWWLFTDGEEYGLLGAEAFARQPGALDRVAAVFNFEGRGNAGPVVLFETGRDDAAWVAAYAEAVRWPQASSLGPTVYERMPNDTDFSVFKRRSLPGLNFAFIGGGSAYHRPWDTPANLDRRSLQHHGEIVLGLARHLGRADLEQLAERAGAASFFTLPGNVLVRYPRAWEPAFALTAAVSAAGAIAFGLRSGALRARGVVLAALGWPTVAVLTAGATVAGSWAIQRLAGAVALALGVGADGTNRGNLLSSTLATLGVVGVAAFLVVLLLRRAPGGRAETLAAGATIGWAALALGAAAVAPGAAHALAWPAFFSALGLHGALRARVLGIGGRWSWLGPWIAAGAALSVLLPVVKLFGQVGSVTAHGAVIFATVPAALASALFLPALQPLVGRSPRFATLGSAAAALGLLIASAAAAAAGL